MYIKHLIGARKGEIEDVAYEAARSLVEHGHAEDIYDQMHLKVAAVVQPEVVSERADLVTTETQTARRKKR